MKAHIFRLIILTSLVVMMNGPCTFAQVGINADNSQPDSSAMLDVKSTEKGLLPPRMTYDQMNAIPSPENGLIVFCTNCNINGVAGCMFAFIAGKWHAFISGCVNPDPPSAGVHIPSQTQIVWNWNTVTCATGYKWNTTNSYATAQDMGTATFKTETGLSCANFYTRYVWAYSEAGASSATTLTQAISPCPLTYPGSTHDEVQCLNAGGAVVPVTEGTLCKFIGSNLSPPSGWTQAGYWQRYNNQGSNGDACGRFIGTLPVIWSNTFGTAYGCSYSAGSATDCSFSTSKWHLTTGLGPIYEVYSVNNPPSYSEPTSGTNVTRIEIGCK